MNDRVAEVLGLVDKLTRGEATPQGTKSEVGRPQGSNGQVCAEPFPAPGNVWQPKRLTPKHRQILTLYAQGMKREEVADFCRVSVGLVGMLARCDLGRAYLTEIEAHMDGRLRALYSKSIDAIEDQLVNGKGENKLKAAALQMRATGKLGSAQDETETAEDVIGRIMNMQVNGPVQINYHGAGAPGAKGGPSDKVLPEPSDT